MAGGVSSSRHPHRNAIADARLAAAPSVWAYLPWLLLYPLYGNALAVLAMIAIFVAIGSNSLLGIPLLAITAIWTLHYLLQVIQRSADGEATPPAMAAEVVFLDGWRTARALIAPGLLAVALVAAEGVAHGALSRLLWLLAIVAAPAYLFVLAFEDVLLRAINPWVWLQLAIGFGSSYLLASGLCMLAASVAAQAVHSGWLLGPGAAISGYLGVLSAHTIGASAAIRRESLDLPVMIRRPQEVADEQQLERQIELLLLRLEAHLQAGDAAGAVAALALDVPPAQRLRLHETLFERLLLRGTPWLIQAQGRELIAVLLSQKRGARALDVFESCNGLHPGFLPSRPEQALSLAEAAAAAGRERLLDLLVARGRDAWPDDAVAARLLFIRIRDLSERRGDDAQARACLPHLLADVRHPDHARFLALASALQRTGGS